MNSPHLLIIKTCQPQRFPLLFPYSSPAGLKDMQISYLVKISNGPCIAYQFNLNVLADPFEVKNFFVHSLPFWIKVIFISSHAA